MADSAQTKTEQPTPRRLERSREQGQVAYSADLTSGIVMLVLSVMALVLSDWFLDEFQHRLASLVMMTQFCSETEAIWVSALRQCLVDTLVLTTPFVALAFFASGITAALLTGVRVAPKALSWDLAKLDPQKGFKRIFSVRSLMRGVISVFKLLALCAIVYAVLSWQNTRMYGVGFTSTQQMVRTTWTLILQIATAVSAALVLLGLLDFMFQKWKHLQDMMMTRQELIDERKEDEGDPHLRARMKKLQREMGQRKMLQDVPSSTVVVTNPTHYAVAIKYERGQVGAPQVVAKGVDHLAFKIIDIAKAHGVAVLERKPLARALYASVEVGGEVPLELYQSVAEVLAYIYSLERAA